MRCFGITMADRLNAKIDSARAARREARMEDALEKYQEIVALSRKNGAKETLIVGLKGLAQIESDRGKFGAALPYYLEAVSQSRELQDELLLAHTIRHLADVHRKIGDLDSAESCYQEAISIYRADSRTSPLELANAIRPMALLMEKLFRIHDAKKLWEEAERLYTSAAVGEGVAECRHAIERCS